MGGQIIPLYPDSGTDAARVQGIPVSVVDPTSGQILEYDSTTRQYVPKDYVAKAGGTFAGNVTLNGTANTAPNQTAASGSSLMTRDLGDARYGIDGNMVAMTGGRSAANKQAWERLVSTLSGNGTAATLTLTANLPADPTGKLVAIWNSTPATWNGLYVVAAWNGSNTLTLTTTKTATYTSGGRVALAFPVAKFTSAGVGRFLGSVTLAAYDSASGLNSAAQFAAFTVETTTGGAVYNSGAYDLSGSDPISGVAANSFRIACAPVANVYYLVYFRGFYNGNSSSYLGTHYFRMIGHNSNMTVTAPTTDYLP